MELKNDELTLSFDEFGGAMTSIKDKEGVEYLWQGDATYWSGQAPVLFPICGSVRDDQTIFSDGSRGKLPRHGLVRKRTFEEKVLNDHQVAYTVKSDEQTLASFPYAFELTITYSLTGKTIRTEYSISNKETSKTMPFFIGGHPGFNCPLFAGEDYKDYYLEFEKEETCTVPRQFLETGLLDLQERKDFFNHEKRLNLDFELFSYDAITLDQLASRSISLRSDKHQKGLRLDFPDFPYLVLWTTANQGPFIALEPWSGLSTSLEESDYFEEKVNVQKLAAGQSASYHFDVTVL